jgi:hypothetical protein
MHTIKWLITMRIFMKILSKYVPRRIALVGKSFHEATGQGVVVYPGNGSHQNPIGAYLSALVFYATIYKESPIGLTYFLLSAQLKTQC